MQTTPMHALHRCHDDGMTTAYGNGRPRAPFESIAARLFILRQR